MGNPVKFITNIQKSVTKEVDEQPKIRRDIQNIRSKINGAIEKIQALPRSDSNHSHCSPRKQDLDQKSYGSHNKQTQEVNKKNVDR